MSKKSLVKESAKSTHLQDGLDMIQNSIGQVVDGFGTIGTQVGQAIPTNWGLEWSTFAVVTFETWLLIGAFILMVISAYRLVRNFLNH
jgi:uncharacterized membrane protein YeaQ/YmgE (transglycosylase-associated protein family)